MTRNLRNLALAAEKVGKPDWAETFSTMIASVKKYGVAASVGDKVFTWDLDAIYREYADEIGKQSLTGDERRLALISHVLAEAE